MRTSIPTRFKCPAPQALLAGLLVLSPSSVLAQAGEAAKTTTAASGAPKGSASATTKAAADNTQAVSQATSHESAEPSLREEIKQLRDELAAVKETTTANEETLKGVSDKVAEATTHNDLEALRDVEEEHILRSVGSSTAISPYPVSGYQHLVNLTGSAGFIYTATPWSTSGTSTRSLRIYTTSLTVSGSLRQDPGAEGDVRYNIAFLGTQNRYAAVANTSQSGAASTAATVDAGTVNGTYLNASDVWVAYDVGTTKLILEPNWTLTFQLGQFLIPFGVEAVSTENNRPTINQAQFVSKLGFSSRDLGLIATGGFLHRNDPSATTIPLINYIVGVFDGAGPNSFDTNTGLDFVGRLAINPFYQYADNFRNMTFGASWYEGNKFSTTGALPIKRRIGADFQWLRKPFLLTSEYVYSKDGYDGYRNTPAKGTGPAPTAAFAKGSTIVTTLFWTPSTLPDFQPWVRWDLFRPWAYTNLTDAQILSSNAAGNWGNRRDAYSVGFNWFVWSVEPLIRRSYDTAHTNRVIKIQASYTRFKQEAFTGAKNQLDFVLIALF
jgi:hypothetical protein